MPARTFAHALQFLTRIPVRRVAEFRPADLSRSALWFPLVGAVIGAALAFAVWAGAHASPWVGALLGLSVWVWITGGLHLDGLADVADALAASHRAPERFLEVLRDPHVGAFGAMAIGLVLIAKVVLLAEIARASALAPLVLVPAWARWGPLVWSLFVPPLASGMGERFSWQISGAAVAALAAVLALLSLWLAPILLLAPVIVAAIAVYWQIRLGGISGDCLGASVETTETLLLLLVALAAA
jgi:adenosylcobinamide-GDP ribazoletransferase